MKFFDVLKLLFLLLICCLLVGPALAGVNVQTTPCPEAVIQAPPAPVVIQQQPVCVETQAVLQTYAVPMVALQTVTVPEVTTRTKTVTVTKQKREGFFARRRAARQSVTLVGTQCVGVEAAGLAEE